MACRSAAENGAAFLLIHAEHDDEAVSTRDALKQVPREFAYRYHSLAIEELK